MTKRIAIDFETYLICEEEGTSPRPVCMSYYNDNYSGVLIGSDIVVFLKSIPEDVEIIAHNLKFEFNVILKHYPELTSWVFSRLEAGTVWCTLISEQIMELSHTVKTNKYALSDLVLRYLGIDISETKKGDDVWRLRYAELIDIPLEEWPLEAVKYSIGDSEYAYKIRAKQSISHLDSVRASVILGMMSDRGFKVRQDYVEEQISLLNTKMIPIQNNLIESDLAGFDKKGIFKKKTKAFQEQLETTEEHLSYTNSNKVATDRKSLGTYSAPIAKQWSSYAHDEKILNTYFKTLGSVRDVIRTEYNAVVDTCRTSSRGSKLLPAVNMQNLPRSGGVREALIARSGYVLCSIDYGSLELVCTAQQLYNVYGKSSMMEALNKGDAPVDMHSILGAYLMGNSLGSTVSYEEFVKNKKNPEYKNYRQLAKPINLGYPGGIGPKRMIVMAKDMYDVDLDYTYAVQLKTTFLSLYPELDLFLNRDASMLKTGQKIVYKAGTPEEKKAPEYSYIVNGVKRAGCTYNAACNGFLMQTPAAIGTKRMLWRAGQAIINNESIYLLAFIHDELLLEIKDDENLENNVEKMSYIMIDAMKEILPDVRVSVEADVGPIWKKDGMGWSKTYWR